MTARGRARPATSAAWGALFAPAAAWPGDDDKPPAYKIYIDPETGKYTTEDPAAKTAGHAAATAAPPAPGAAAATGDGRPLGTIAAAVIIIIVLLAAALVWQRRQPAN